MIAALLAVALHLGSLRHGYTFDDPHIVVENPLVTGDGGLWPVLTTHYWAGMAPEGTLYRPLTVATYWAQHRLAGTAPWSYHLVNVVLHAGVTFLFFMLARRLASLEAALAAALLFAAHPVHTEAVVNVAGRAELLAALGVIGAWLWRGRPAVALPLFGAALLSKESAVALPGLMMLEDLVRGGRVRWRSIAPHAAAVAGFVALRCLVVGPGLSSPSDPFVGVAAWQRVMTALEVMGREAALVAVPWRLSADYSYDQIPVVVSPFQLSFLLGCAVLAACAAAAMRARRRVPAVTLGIASFSMALLPVSNLPFGIGVIMAERLLYLPSAGACLAAGAALAALAGKLPAGFFADLRAAGAAAPKGGIPSAPAGAASRPAVLPAERRPRHLPWWTPACKAAAAVALIPACLFCLRTAIRVNEWFDQVTLFEATVRDSPRSALAHVNLATAYQAQGRLADAERHFREAASIAPHRPGTHFNLGVTLERQGRLDEAASAYHESLRRAPGDGRAASSLRRVEHLLASRRSGGRGARPVL